MKFTLCFCTALLLRNLAFCALQHLSKHANKKPNKTHKWVDSLKNLRLKFYLTYMKKLAIKVQ